MKTLLTLAAASLAVALCSPGARAQNQGTVQCNQSAMLSNASGGTQQLVAAASSGGQGERIYVCGYSLNVGATATTLGLAYGTGSNCATGLTPLTPAWALAVDGQFIDNAYGAPLVVPPGNALCVSVGAATAMGALVRYLQQPGM